MIQPHKLSMVVNAVQEIQGSLAKLDKFYAQLNEDSLKALNNNPDYKLVEDWSSNFIEFKYEEEGFAMNKVKFALQGCDDSTTIEIEVTNKELKFLERLEILTNEASSYGCEPTLDIIEVKGV